MHNTGRAGGGLRADARRNRSKIVAAARVVMLQHGPQVPIEVIARGAGVDVATVYRRFPNREALVAELALVTYRRLLTSARIRADDEPEAWTALHRFFWESAADLRIASWLSFWYPRTWTWTIARGSRQNQQLRMSLLDVLDDLVHRAQREGSMRTDVGTGDLALLIALVLRPTPGLLGRLSEQEASSRYLAIALDGLRALPIDPLPGRPVTVHDLDPVGEQPPPAHSEPGSRWMAATSSVGEKRRQARVVQ